jgi:DNA-binding NarL/FixJ family response regulator
MYSATIAVLGTRPLVRRGLEGLLRTVDSYEVVPGYGSVKELFAREELIDALVLDLDRSVIDELLDTVRSRLPVPHAVAVYESADESLAVRCGGLGIGAAVVLDAEPSALLDTLAGELADAGPVVVTAPPARRAQPSLLTERETEVLQLIAEGLTTKDVSVQLGISPKTVENYKQHMFSKLGVQSRAHAVAVGSRLGLLAAAAVRCAAPAGTGLRSPVALAMGVAR